MKIGRSAIQKNLLANFFGIGVQLLNQVILVPLYLHFWDTDLYSDWIVITAVSSFFSMSDIGLNSVTANQFTITYTKRDFKECNSLLSNNYLLIFCIASVALLLSVGYVFCFDIVSSLGLHALNRAEGSYIFLVLVTYIFIGMGCSVIDSVYRANSLNHKSVYLGNLARLLECSIILVALFVHIEMTIMVTIYILPKIIIYFYKLYDTRKLFRYKFRFSDIDISLLKKITLPSVAFMSFPLGNAIVYQGFTLVVNKYFGASPVILFNTTRTMCNFLRQLLSSMQQAVWPEYSIAYGKNDISRMRELHRKAFSVATIGAVVLSIFLLLFGPLVYEVWTHGKIVFSYSLMIAFLLVLLTENTWTTSSVCLMATNRHAQIGVAYVSTAALSIVCAVLVANIVHSIPLVVYCLLLIHIPLSIYAIKKGIEMTQDSLSGLLSSMNIKKLISKS